MHSPFRNREKKEMVNHTLNHIKGVTDRGWAVAGGDWRVPEGGWTVTDSGSAVVLGAP